MQVIRQGDEQGEAMLIQDLLLKRQYNLDHTPMSTEAEVDSLPIAETSTKTGFRLFIAKLTGGTI